MGPGCTASTCDGASRSSTRKYRRSDASPVSGTTFAPRAAKTGLSQKLVDACARIAAVGRSSFSRITRMLPRRPEVTKSTITYVRSRVSVTFVSERSRIARSPIRRSPGASSPSACRSVTPVHDVSPGTRTPSVTMHSRSIDPAPTSTSSHRIESLDARGRIDARACTPAAARRPAGAASRSDVCR